MYPDEQVITRAISDHSLLLLLYGYLTDAWQRALLYGEDLQQGAFLACNHY